MELHPSSKFISRSKTSTTEFEHHKRKELELTDDKMRHLIGCSGRNISLLQLKLNLRIIVPEKLITNEDGAPTSDEKFVVTLIADGVFDFADVEANKPWQKQVQRWIKSATRGGFVKYMSQEEINQIGKFGMEKMIQKFCEVEAAYKVTMEKVQVLPGEYCWIVLEEPGCVKGKLESAIEILGDLMHNRHNNRRFVQDKKGRG